MVDRFLKVVEQLAKEVSQTKRLREEVVLLTNSIESGDLEPYMQFKVAHSGNAAHAPRCCLSNWLLSFACRVRDVSRWCDTTVDGSYSQALWGRSCFFLLCCLAPLICVTICMPVFSSVWLHDTTVGTEVASHLQFCFWGTASMPERARTETRWVLCTFKPTRWFSRGRGLFELQKESPHLLRCRLWKARTF